MRATSQPVKSTIDEGQFVFPIRLENVENVATRLTSNHLPIGRLGPLIDTDV